MRFADLIAGMPEIAASWQAHAALDVRGITADSRAVAPGMIFAALQGTRADGRAFIGDAVARGAVAVLAPPGTPVPEGCVLLADAAPRRRLALLASAFAGPPPATVVAVTGTNGKTSTVDFLRQLWTLAGLKAASLGTLGLIAPGHPGGDGLTTPDPVALAETMAALKREGVEHVAVEASSHGLDQHRLDGLAPAAAGFTSLSRDHLDYHGDMATYRAAKLRLFAALLAPGSTVVAAANLETETLDALAAICATRGLALLTVGEGGDAITLHTATPTPDGQTLALTADGRRQEIRIALPGRFQADNALVAAGLARATGVPDALALLPRLAGVRGRMERAARLANGAAAYVDYAHTPDALERLLTALRPHTTGRLHVIVGAGGDRDRGKRKLMGAACARYADRVIVTDDNPRSEDPAAIRAAVMEGCPGATEIAGREAAIAAGLAALAPGDILAVAGKGHEQGQTIGTTVHPFDDASVIRRLAEAA